MPQKKGRTILIVDDDVDFRTFVKKVLENLGHEVFEAENTTDASHLAETVIPHLILLDINLVEEKGFLLLEKLKVIDKHRRIKVVMISASTSKRDIALSKNHGVDGYMVKPVTNNQLVTLLKKMGPKLALPPYKIPDSHKPLHVKANCYGTISKVSELMMKFKSKVKFSGDKEKIDIYSTFFKKLDLEHLQFTVSQPSLSTSPGNYETTIQFMGLSNHDMTELRKLKTKKV